MSPLAVAVKMEEEEENYWPRAAASPALSALVLVHVLLSASSLRPSCSPPAVSPSAPAPPRCLLFQIMFYSRSFTLPQSHPFALGIPPFANAPLRIVQSRFSIACASVLVFTINRAIYVTSLSSRCQPSWSSYFRHRCRGQLQVSPSTRSSASHFPPLALPPICPRTYECMLVLGAPPPNIHCEHGPLHGLVAHQISDGCTTIRSPPATSTSASLWHRSLPPSPHHSCGGRTHPSTLSPLSDIRVP